MSLNLNLIYSQFNFEMANPTNQNTYEFEGFRLDASHLLLFKNGVEISLAPKVVETLLVLVENRGKVLSKDEIMSLVWENSFVEEGNLSQNLHRLRKILGETKDGKPFIETLRRRGYRFVPEVSLVKTEEKISSSAFRRIPADSVSLPNGELLENAAFNSSEKLSERETRHIPLVNGNHTGFQKSEPQNIYDAIHPKFRYRALLIAGLVALLVAGSLGFVWRFALNRQLSASKEIKLKRLTESGNVNGAAISPDGNSLAYVVREGKSSSLRLKNISTESEVVIVSSDSEKKLGIPRFSPDGNYIYYGNSEGIFQIPVFGGESRKIASNNWGNFFVSPDGSQIAFPRGDLTKNKSYVVVANTDGSGERVVATRISPDYYVGWEVAPVWSPDGEHLTVVAARAGVPDMRLFEVSLQTGEESEIKTQNEWESISYVDWTSPDELIVSGQKKDEIYTQLWKVTFPGSAAERITNDFSDYIDFTLSKKTGKLVAYQRTENLHLWIYDKETGAARQITSGVNLSDGRFGLAFAPDGRIIYTARDKNNYDVFSVNSDGSDVRQLTKNAGRRNWNPAVSPDNRFIVFNSDRTGMPRLYIMNVDGSNERRLTSDSVEKENSEESPYFSPDGKWIYYVFYRAGKGSIRKISIGGGESFPVSRTDKNVFEPVPSPDGKFLAHAIYNDESETPWEIGVMSLENPSAKERYYNFPAFRLRPRWTLDSKSLFSIDDASEGHNLWQTNLETGERRQITNFPAERIPRFDISPDGRFLVLSRGKQDRDAILIEY